MLSTWHILAIFLAYLWQMSIFGNFSQPGLHIEKKKKYFLQNNCDGSLKHGLRNGKSNLPPIWRVSIHIVDVLEMLIRITLNGFSILQLPWPSLPIYQRCSGAATTFIYPFTFLSVPKTCMTCKCWVNTRNFHNTRQLQEEHSSKATFLSPRISQYKVIKRAHITNTVSISQQGHPSKEIYYVVWQYTLWTETSISKWTFS